MPASVASRHSQRGTAAIEFGLLFLLFFAVFYALVSYALPMLMTQAFHHAAAASARATVKIDLVSLGEGAEEAIAQEARTTVKELLSWLPPKAKAEVLGTDAQKVQVAFNSATGIVTVTIRYPNYPGNPLMPILKLPGFGEVPRLPQDLVGTASLEL